MQKKFITITLISFLSMLLIGCATLKDYKPKSSKEKAIKIVLLKYESTWNNHDEQGFLALWHDNGKIMTGRDHKLVSKKEYVKIIPERMATYPKFNLGAPKMSIMGDKANVKVTILIGGHGFLHTFRLVNENNKWLIMRADY